jgi:ADP-ribosylglycohydrolase
MNAGNPRAAYAEAIDFAAAHQWSYGREAAGVMAACVAAAATPRANIAEVIDAGTQLARDGTATAIRVALDAVRGLTDWRAAVEPLQAALLPFMPGGWTADRRPSGQPSRDGAIEELPAALALLAVTGGEFSESVIAAANYGHDADSIAVMAGCIAGALGGTAAIPTAWAETVTERNRINFAAMGAELHEMFVDLETRAWGEACARRERLGLGEKERV